jgi:all-trans-retinol dehydrogenase (NAD+)
MDEFVFGAGFPAGRLQPRGGRGGGMTSLRDSTILITGAASGLGARLAREAAGRGARVVGWDRDGDRLDRFVEELRPLSPGAAGYTVDVTDRQAVADAGRRVLAEIGPVDVLVNNAGVVSGKLLSDLSEEAIERTFAVNTLGLFWCTKAFLPTMIERRRGHVVTLASAGGLVGVVRQTDYSASKHAAVGFAESLRYEMRRYCPQVRTTVVCPFYINTGMFDGAHSRLPWLLPILDEAKVAAKIVRAIERDRRQLLMPPAVALLPVLRALPVPVFDRVMDLLGINVSMDEFVGRTSPVG